ncbi:MAG: ABC transporter permease [Patescibacteria group bacterium]|nr:ABC transporter permease [Patescibacteria group bacterium]
MLKTILTIWKKEIRDTIRDRRTLLAMVVMPMFLMPVLTIGLFKFMDYQMEKQAEKIVKVSIVEEGEAPAFVEMIKNEDKIEIVEFVSSESSARDSDGARVLSKFSTENSDWAGETNNNIKEAIAEGNLDLGIIIPENFQENIKSQEVVEITIIQKSTNMDSESALARIYFLVASFNDELLQERFADQEINPKILSKVVVVPEDVASEKETGGFILGLMIPLFIVMWSIMGGQYTAIDVSAGEKERKTLESLLFVPLKRIDIVLGKFLAVSTVSLTSVIISIGSFYIALIYSGGFGPMSTNIKGLDTEKMAESVVVNFSIDPQAILILLVVSLFLVLMFSAMILSVAIFAKSFKEAQSYISPSYLVVILPVILVNSMPGFEPALWFFALPAVNATLLFKEILMGVYNSGHILLTLSSLIIYSIIAIFIATKIYSKEGVLFRD